ncbi:MAG: winged helix-turn-helix domain-containing protein [Vicinamibacteria bacterium]|nr:winged helix-turn-helix domain-containing protein [Vicinamibacteria bacterium]
MGAETATLAAIASPRRREILRLAWQQERPAGEIHRAMGDLTFGAVSQHLRALHDAGLLELRAVGRHRLYRARREAFGPVGELLERMWDDALWRLKQQAELLERRRGPQPRRLARRRKGTT